MSKIDTIIDNLQDKEMWPVDPSRFIRDQHDYIMSISANIKQFASDLEAQEYYSLAEEALKCLEVE